MNNFKFYSIHRADQYHPYTIFWLYVLKCFITMDGNHPFFKALMCFNKPPKHFPLLIGIITKGIIPRKIEWNVFVINGFKLIFLRSLLACLKKIKYLLLYLALYVYDQLKNKLRFFTTLLMKKFKNVLHNVKIIIFTLY